MTDSSKPLEFRSSGCAEFQEQLPELFEAGATVSNHPHLQTCKNCSSLVRDLEYIAEQAKHLLDPAEPSDTLWENIKLAIHQEETSSSDAAGRTKG